MSFHFIVSSSISIINVSSLGNILRNILTYVGFILWWIFQVNM
jgi:hypothetical protein